MEVPAGVGRTTESLSVDRVAYVVSKRSPFSLKTIVHKTLLVREPLFSFLPFWGKGRLWRGGSGQCSTARRRIRETLMPVRTVGVVEKFS